MKTTTKLVNTLSKAYIITSKEYARTLRKAFHAEIADF